MIRTQMKIRRWIAGLLLICLLCSMTACSGNGNSDATSDSAAGHATGESGIVDPEDLTAEDEEQTTEETVSPAPVVETMGGFAVSSSTEESTRVGMQILSSGGNAVDAAAAISFMLSVSEPYSSGIGGGGIMLVYDSKTGKARTLDYYGCAGSSPVMTDQVAVPGVVAGMEKALELWGTMSLADVIQPSIDYAEEGFTASDMFIYRLSFSDNLRRYNPAFTNLREGDVLKQKELAETFRAIQAGGSDAFYRGEIAEKIAEKCSLTTEDLANYEAKVRKVVRSEFNGWKMLGSYAPSSSLTVLQMLKVAEMLDIPDP
ncbi:MAG: gamma-glutamyltransferase, partial [Oscillospiraceae bacterium]|nr:gamma-glutamyltransferase [Oscillospiraceae bacterium]